MPADEFFQNIRYVTLKVTDGCNLKCSYCNVEADLPTTPRMSMEVFKRVADLLFRNSRSPRVGLEFHGGEPLLLTDEWYGEAVQYAAYLAKQTGKLVAHPLQTNGTRLTEERLDYLRGLGIDIGVSYDGPPHLNDHFRMGGRQVKSASLRLAKRKAERHEGFGLILVMSRANYAHMYEVMEHFRDIGITDYRVNFLQPQGWGMNQHVLTGEEMFEGMQAVFQHMADTDCAVMEADIEMMVNRFIAGRLAKPGLSCWEMECQAGRSYCAVDHKGDVHACGTDLSNHRLGHINREFDAAHVKSTLDRLHRKDAWFTRCFDCNAKQICNMSCPTSDHNDLVYREAECGYTRLLYQHFHENPEVVERVYDGIGRKRPFRSR